MENIAAPSTLETTKPDNALDKIDLLKLLPSNFLSLVKTHIFNETLFPYQVDDLLIELEDILFGYGNSLTRERARQSGKTTSIIILAEICMVLFPELAKQEKYTDIFPALHIFKNGFNIVIVAPKDKQARITLRRLKSISMKPYYIKLLETLEIEVTNKSLDLFGLSNGSSIIALSGNPISVTEGESAHLLIFDEAHRIVTYSWHKAYSPMVSSTNGTIVSYGISWTARLSFYNQIQMNKAEEKEGKNKGEIRKLHSRIPYTEAQKYSDNYAKWVKKELTRISADSIEFQLNFLLVWHLKTGNPITPELWDNIDMIGDYRPGETTSDNLYVGIDWGKTTTNTFVTIIEKTLECLKYIDLLELQGDDYPQQHLAIQIFLNKYPKIKKIWSESTGVGDTNTDFLKASFGDKVIPVTAFNLPTLHDKLLNEIKYKRLIRPRIKDFGPWISLTRQFLNCEKIYTGASFKLIGPTDELDDAIDSSSLSVGAALTDILYDFVYKKSSALAMSQRVNFTPTKRIVTQSKLFKNKSKYQEHLRNF
ncbi:MAG TPA: hypothetical protein ENI23_07710 [bacterium]|nr:hypothetical protein [bacterium]